MSDKGAWDPGAKYTAYLNEIKDILSNGEKRTVRGVYYAMESRGFPDKLKQKSYDHQLGKHMEDPDTEPHPDNLHPSEWAWEFAYKYVKRCVKKGRRAGEIDPRLIIDASREPSNVPSTGWDDPEAFFEDRIAEIWTDYWENFWDYQPNYVEVWLEKQALASLFEPICRRHAVRLEATRGDWSDSKVYEAAERLREELMDGKDVKILYFGDFNPSGYHAPVSVLDTLEYYGIPLGRQFPKGEDPRHWDVEHNTPFTFTNVEGTLDIERVAINLDHIEEFDLPENPVPSATDSHETTKRHFQRYVSDGRDTNIELNALKEWERDFLENLIEESIEKHINDEKRQQVNQRIAHGRDVLDETVEVHFDRMGEFEPPIQRDEDAES